MLCNHGYFLTDCKPCAPAPGECDYGSCEAPATERVATTRDVRCVCHAHAQTIILRQSQYLRIDNA